MARRRRRDLALETPSSAGDINTAMLLYKAPSGIAVFSFDVRYLGIGKDVWRTLPSLSLKAFIKSETVCSPIDFANKSVDSLLADTLTELCGYEKTLVVRSAEYKRIFETKLGITCMHVDVPDSEVIKYHLKDVERNFLGFPDDASAMLLYEAPSGISIFSFDKSYLNGLSKDFWACLPPLVKFMAYERVPKPIDLDTEAIDDRLSKRLKKLCGSEKELVVGRAEHKRIIEMQEQITCLHVDIPDCEVIICSLKKPMGTSLPDEEKADPEKNITLFLRQHHFDIPDEKVEESYYAPALGLHKVELCEKNYLAFFRLLLNKFMSRSGIDTKNWILIQFATALKMICHPRASYEVHHPDEIFLFDVYSKIVDHSPGYKGGFLKIDVLAVYNEVLSLCSQKSRHLYKLDALVRKAAKMKAKSEKHPSVEVPNEFCEEIDNNGSKSKEAAEETGKLEADNSVLGSVMGELDATSTLLEDKESKAALCYDDVRHLEDELTTRPIDVTIDPAEKDTPDLSVAIDEAADANVEVEGLTDALNSVSLACSDIWALTKQKNEHPLARAEQILGMLKQELQLMIGMPWEKMHYHRGSELERFINYLRKLDEEIVAIKAQTDKYLAVVNEKETENAELLKKLRHLVAQLQDANKTSEDAAKDENQ